MSGQWQRACVEKRDRGICSGCGFDTAIADRVLHHLRRLEDKIAGRARAIEDERWGRYARMWANRRADWPGPAALDVWLREHHPTMMADLDAAKETRALLLHVWTGKLNWRGALWEADHVVPVSEGGGGCGLEGFRTLCARCHKLATAALAARLAAAKRSGAPAPSFSEMTFTPSVAK